MAHKKSYRELQEQLDVVLEELQVTELDIDKALELHKKGEVLLKELEEYLKTAKNHVEHIKK